MTGITLNLASRPFRNNVIVGSVLAAAAAALIAATVSNGYIFLNYGGRYKLLQAEERQHRERLAALESDERTLSRQIQSRDFRRLYGRGQFAGDLILRRSFSWTLLFNKLEDLVPPEVMMTAIRPHITGEKTIIRVDGVAKNHGGLIAFEDALQKNPVFARVYPVYERRVNPSRSEIDFALDFDYIPAKTVSGPDAIAAGAAPAGSPAPTPGAVQPSSSPTAVAAGPTPATGHGTASAAAPEAPRAAEAGKPAPVAPGQVIGTVGRDGRPRTPDLLARVIAAPGGFYPQPSPSATPGPADASTKKPRGKPHDARPAPAQDAPAAAPGQHGTPGTPGAEGAPAETVTGSAPHAAAPSGGASRPSVSAGSPATWQDGASVPGTRASLAAGRVPARPGRGTGGTRGLPPVPATRLDVPLTFLSRPVGDVYAALSQAYGVRIEIDPTVDQRARVTADLAGKNLHDAFASVSKQTGHRVVRVEEGLYRVVPLAGGEPLADRPVQEEPLPGTEAKP
jgi:hypothetical protein